MVEQNAIWVSHMTRLIRIALEHVRLLSNHEQLVARSIQELGSSPIQGSGVFQYQDLFQQSGQRPTESFSAPSPDSASFRQPDPQIAGNQSEPTKGERPRPASVGIAPQPDTEPDLELPTTPNNPETLMPDASLVPIPPESDDELMVDSIDFDTWKIHGNFLIRVHNIPRIRLFNPRPDPSCPVPHTAILPDRWTTGRYRTGDWFKIHETWENNPESHRTLAEIWTGQSVFDIDPTKMTSVGSHETHHISEEGL